MQKQATGWLRPFGKGRYGVKVGNVSKASFQTLLPQLRALPGARFDWDTKTWTVSADEAHLADLLQAAQEIGLAIDPSIISRAGKVAESQDSKMSTGRAGDERLFPFQKEGVAWLQDRTKALLADQMGLGKTVQIAMALPDNARAVVVCPSTLKRNWLKELQTWRPDLTPVLLQGRNGFNRWPKAGEVFLVNYEILPKVVPAGCPQGVTLIADEVQKVKNRKATRTQRWTALVAAALSQAGRVWIATGTPLLNTPPELWQVLDGAQMAEDAFEHFGRFYWLFQATSNGYGTEWGMPRPQVASLMKTVMLRREREDVLADLPSKRFQFVGVNGLDKETKALCDAAMGAWDEAGDPNTLPDFSEMSHAREALTRAKVPALLELVETYEESGEPVVVFSDHRAPIDILAEREGWRAIHGDVGHAKRQEAVEAFQRGELKGLALTITAGGEGLTLTRADAMIFCGQNWVPANNVQAEDRICRIDPLGRQRNAVVYTILQAEHALDQRVTELLHKKAELFRQTIKPTSKGNGNSLKALVEEVAQVQETLEEPEDAETVKCIECGAKVEVRVSGPQAKNPNRKYAKCSCGNFQWADGTALKKVSQAAKDWALKAARFLSGMCDGAVALDDRGFNKFDAKFGRETAYQGSLTPGHTVAAYKMLGKYRGQLANAGLWPRPELHEES